MSLQHCLSAGLTSSYQVTMTASMLLFYRVRTPYRLEALTIHNHIHQAFVNVHLKFEHATLSIFGHTFFVKARHLHEGCGHTMQDYFSYME